MILSHVCDSFSFSCVWEIDLLRSMMFSNRGSLPYRGSRRLCGKASVTSMICFDQSWCFLGLRHGWHPICRDLASLPSTGSHLNGSVLRFSGTGGVLRVHPFQLIRWLDSMQSYEHLCLLKCPLFCLLSFDCGESALIFWRPLVPRTCSPLSLSHRIFLLSAT